MSATYLIKVTFSSSLDVSADHVIIRASPGDNGVSITREINKMLATYRCPPVADIAIKIENTSSGRPAYVTGYKTLRSVGFSPKTDPEDPVNTAVACKASETRSSDCLIL